MDWITQNGESGSRHRASFAISLGTRTLHIGLMSRRPVYSALPHFSSCANPLVRTYRRPYDAVPFFEVLSSLEFRRIQWTMPSPSNQWYRLAPSIGSCAGLGPLRRYTPSSPGGRTPSTTRSSSVHSPTTGAKLPRRGGLSLSAAHAGGAESSRYSFCRDDDSFSSSSSSSAARSTSANVAGDVDARRGIRDDPRPRRCDGDGLVGIPLRTEREGVARAAIV